MEKTTYNFACNYCLAKKKDGTIYEGEDCYIDGMVCSDSDCIEEHKTNPIVEE